MAEAYPTEFAQFDVERKAMLRGYVSAAFDTAGGPAVYMVMQLSSLAEGDEVEDVEQLVVIPPKIVDLLLADLMEHKAELS